MAMAEVTAIALAPEAAGDYETVGGGTFAVNNSDTPCTQFRNGTALYTFCPGSWINLPPGAGDYIVVPLGVPLVGVVRYLRTEWSVV